MPNHAARKPKIRSKSRYGSVHTIYSRTSVCPQPSFACRRHWKPALFHFLGGLKGTRRMRAMRGVSVMSGLRSGDESVLYVVWIEILVTYMISSPSSASVLNTQSLCTFGQTEEFVFIFIRCNEHYQLFKKKDWQCKNLTEKSTMISNWIL